jgi:RES domain-containing protein
MQAHSRSDEISAAIANCIQSATAWSGTFFRATTTSYANSLELLSGKGSQKHGGRWTPPGLFRSVYGSLDPYTAMSETLGQYENYGIPVSQGMPLVIVGVIARLQAVLDIDSLEFLSPLGLTVADLVQVNWNSEQDAGHEALTQAVGRNAYAAGLEAILVPSSSVAAKRNIVIFPRRRRKGSSIRIENVRELPKRKGKA